MTGQADASSKVVMVLQVGWTTERARALADLDGAGHAGCPPLGASDASGESVGASVENRVAPHAVASCRSGALVRASLILAPLSSGSLVLAALSRAAAGLSGAGHEGRTARSEPCCAQRPGSRDAHDDLHVHDGHCALPSRRPRQEHVAPGWRRAEVLQPWYRLVPRWSMWQPVTAGTRLSACLLSVLPGGGGVDAGAPQLLGHARELGVTRLELARSPQVLLRTLEPP